MPKGWKARALRAAEAVLADWRARPLGPHNPECCALCIEFAGCRGCPVPPHTGRVCRDHPFHTAWLAASKACDAPGMELAAERLTRDMVVMIDGIRTGRIRRGRRKAE